MRHALSLLVLCVAGALAHPAHADDDYSWAARDYEYASGLSNDFYDRFHRDLVDPTTKRVRAGARGRAGAVSTRVPARAPRMPAKLAATAPAAERAERRRQYDALLAGYHDLAKRFGLPKHDVAAALAAFVYASYMAYRGAQIPDEHFRALVAQLRSSLAGMPAFARATTAEKQDMYEQLAILAMTLAVARAGASPATEQQVRDAGKRHLQSMLGLDVTRLELGPAGMSLAR